MKKNLYLCLMNGKEILCYFILRQLAIDRVVVKTSKELESYFKCDKKKRVVILNTLVNKGLVEIIRNPGKVQSYKLLDHDLYEKSIPLFIYEDINEGFKKLACEIYYNLDKYKSYTMVREVQDLLDISKDTLWRFNSYIKDNPLHITLDELITPKNTEVSQKKLEDKENEKIKIWEDLKDVTQELNYIKCIGCNTLKTENYYYSTNRSRCKVCCGDKTKEYYRKNITCLEDDNKGFFKAKIAKCKGSAKARGINFNLTQEDLYSLYLKQNKLCHYTELPFDSKNKYDTLSIDRIDSTLGYTKDNIVLCLYIINMMKTDLPIRDFKKYLQAIKINNL